jgi:hypothetical protein
MSGYTHITIEDKKRLVSERMKNNENGIYHLTLALLESNTNGATEDEISQIHQGIERASANMTVLYGILDDLNNGIDVFTEY